MSSVLRRLLGSPVSDKLALYRNGEKLCDWRHGSNLPLTALCYGITPEQCEKAVHGERIAFTSAGFLELLPLTPSFRPSVLEA